MVVCVVHFPVTMLAGCTSFPSMAAVAEKYARMTLIDVKLHEIFACRNGTVPGHTLQFLAVDLSSQKTKNNSLSKHTHTHAYIIYARVIQHTYIPASFFVVGSFRLQGLPFVHGIDGVASQERHLGVGHGGDLRALQRSGRRGSPSGFHFQVPEVGVCD